MASKPPPLRRSSQKQLRAEPDVKSLPIDAQHKQEQRGQLEEREELEGRGETG
jgi:hypothetical protein